MPDIIKREDRALTAVEFQGLLEIPAELEWFTNITNEKTRRAYKNDVTEFSRFIGLRSPEEMRLVTRAHVISWRKQLESRALATSTIRRKLSAVSSLFDYLCEKNAVTHNPVNGVKRPMANNFQISCPALAEQTNEQSH